MRSSAWIGIGRCDMSIGKMNAFIDIVESKADKDEEGFTSTGDTVLASVRAYHEQRHGSEKWASLAAFSTSTDLFRFRVIPHLTISTSHFICHGGERFNITSVEDVKDRGMYIEVLTEKVVGSIGES